jgi:hypothetical protein
MDTTSIAMIMRISEQPSGSSNSRSAREAVKEVRTQAACCD